MRTSRPTKIHFNGSFPICLYMKFFFTHLRSALNVRDFLGAVRFVNTEIAFNLRNVDSGPTFATTLRRVLRRAGAFIDAEYPIRVPFFRGPMRLRRVFIWFHCTKSYDVGPGGGGGAGCEGILGAGTIGLVLNAFVNPSICYSAGFSVCLAHALHPGGGPANTVRPAFVKYKKRTTNTSRRIHSHIYLLGHAISCVTIPLNMMRRNSCPSTRTTEHLRRGPDRTMRSTASVCNAI